MTETFGTVLKAKRREAGVSQRELAERVGLDFTYISKLENDRIPPPAADTLVKICQVLGIEPEELLALTGKLPSEVQETVGTKRAAQEFLRAAHKMNLTDDEWEALVKSLQNLRGDS